MNGAVNADFTRFFSRGGRVSEFSEQRISAIIDRFYRAAANPSEWRAVLNEMADVFGAEGVCLVPGPTASLAPICSEALDAPFDHGVRNGWFDDSPRFSRGMPRIKKSDDLVTESMLFSPAELDRLPFNAEFVNRFGLRWFVGGALVPGDSDGIAFSIERREQQERFSDGEIAVIKTILPHFQRVGRIGMEWSKAKASGMADAFERMGSGAILLDFHGRVARLSARAEAHVGSAVSVVQKFLLATDKEANAELQRLIGAAIGGGGGNSRISVALPRTGGRPVIAHAAPVKGEAGEVFKSAHAIIVLTDPDEQLPLDEMGLRQAFRLTQAEIRLAKRLALGADVADASRALGIEASTARTQLKSIFAKTNTHRQAELAVLLNRLKQTSGRD